MFILLLLFLLFTPEITFAWGPLTHTYLSQQIFNFTNLIPLSVLSLIQTYRPYFTYGNIIPDMVIGKKYISQDKNPHTWKAGFTLLEEARTPEEKSFAYGFLTHLAADAILHHSIKDLNSLQHALFELKADRIIDRFYWLQIMTISKKVRKISDRFFEQTVTNPFFSFKTSRRIYKSLIFLSAFNTGDLKNLDKFNNLHLNSLTAMLEILNYKEKATIINFSPLHK